MGKEHKLLHGEFVTGVTATVDNIENRNRQQHFRCLVTGQLGQVLEKGKLLVSGGSLGDCQ